MNQNIKRTQVLFWCGVILLKGSPHNVEGILSSSDKGENNSMSIEDDVLFVSVNATEEDVQEMSSRIRFV